MKVAVVIPVYRELDELEKISLAQCRKVLRRYPLIFVAPEGKNFSYFESGDIVIHFPKKCFRGVRAYSDLLMMPFFYEPFLDFDYILIYQLDAFVFYDALEEFCALGYDYIGAPWPYYARRNFDDLKNVRVGNGGFCLRKVKAHYDLLTNHADLANHMMDIAEDDFFAYCGARKDINFSVPPVKIAAKFSVEYLLKHSLKYIGSKLPFGCHGWTKMDADFYVKLMAQFGYDLRPLRSQMKNVDYDMLKMSLYDFAIQRLFQRLQRGRALSRYLPTKKFASIRVIRSPEAMKILSRLLTDENSLTDKIFIYDEENWTDLLRDVTIEKLPHLIISDDYDVSLIKAFERDGLHYGEQIFSFRQEYLERCKELFHRLGK